MYFKVVSVYNAKTGRRLYIYKEAIGYEISKYLFDRNGVVPKMLILMKSLQKRKYKSIHIITEQLKMSKYNDDKCLRINKKYYDDLR